MSYSISASQLEQIRSAVLSQASYYQDVFTNKVLLHLSKRSKVSYIAVAVALYVAVKAYTTVAYPRNLKHIKRIPALTWMSSLMRREPHLHREEKFIIPTWKETNGMVAVYGQFGWEVNVTNPEAVRTILYKTGKNNQRAFVSFADV